LRQHRFNAGHQHLCAVQQAFQSVVRGHAQLR